ncbi:E3 ubiquitin-protein ligase MIB2 [Octopus bimaculoides]|nr:E3 ubiquitin-protein ligase MIB2 [Octopus bimaculoides]
MTFLLSQFSVKVDIRNCDNMTPLLEAVSRGHLGMIRKLIARGADVNAVNNEGSNCLHLAVKRTVFHSEYRPLCLLDKFCTELKLSKEKRLSGVVAACYLASKGADFYHKNYKSNAPLDLIENGNLKEKLRTFLLSRCMLCEVNEATVELQPCAHNAVCGECYTIKLKRCPKCRTCIKSKSKFDSLKMEENHFHSTAKILSVKQQQVVIPELNKKDLLMVAKRLGGKWQRAGIFLEIETYQLDVIKHDNPNDTVEQSFQMLYRWFTSCDPDTRTTKTLREALEEAECFDALKCLSSEEK